MEKQMKEKSEDFIVGLAANCAVAVCDVFRVRKLWYLKGFGEYTFDMTSPIPQKAFKKC